MFRKQRIEGRQRPRGDLGEGLARRHEVEIVVGSDSEALKHLVKHRAMLRSDADFDRDAILQFPHVADDGAELDGLRPRAENEEYLFHVWIDLFPAEACGPRSFTVTRRGFRMRVMARSYA